MEMKSGILLAGILISFYLQESYGIQCYDCMFCNDPFDEEGKATANCYGSCRKFKAASGGQLHVVTRSCRSQYEEEFCHTVGSTGTVCYCNTDLCNSSVMPEISVTLLLTVGIGHFLYDAIR